MLSRFAIIDSGNLGVTSSTTVRKKTPTQKINMVKQNIYRTASHIHLFLGNSLLLNHRNTLLFWVPTLPLYQLAWENNWTKKVFKYIMEVDWLTWRQTCKKIEFPKHSYSTILLWSMFLPQFSTLTGISKHLLFAANFSHSLYITLLISFVWNTLHILFICLLYTSLFICFIHFFTIFL